MSEPLKSFKQGLADIVSSISRKKGNFFVAYNPDLDDVANNPYVLAVGAPDVVKLNGGYASCIGLNREKLTKLRDWCNELLGERTS